MIKSYLLIGSLIFAGAAAIGGAAFYKSSPDDSSPTLSAGTNSSSPLFMSGARPGSKAEPIPLPMWVMQKILNPSAATGQPIPCPVWMLYQMSQNTKSGDPK